MSYNEKNINSLDSFCAADLDDIDSQIVKYSYHNPRHTIQLCDRIVRYTARVAYDVNFCITKQIFDKALKDFCFAVSKSIYTENYLQALIDFQKEMIVDKEFAEANEITVEESHKILDELTHLGALSSRSKLNGEKEYTVRDPRISYLVTDSLKNSK